MTLKTKVFGDYNHARVGVSWIISTRGLLLRGYTVLGEKLSAVLLVSNTTTRLMRQWNVSTWQKLNVAGLCSLQCSFAVAIYPLLLLICAISYLDQAIPMEQEVKSLLFVRCVCCLMLELSPFQIESLLCGIACQHRCRVQTLVLSSRQVFCSTALPIPSWTLWCL